MISAVLCRLWQARKEKEQRAQLLMEEGKQKLEAKEFAIAEKTFASGKRGRISKSSPHAFVDSWPSRHHDAEI